MGSYVLVVVLLLCFGFSYGFVPFSQPISLTGPRMDNIDVLHAIEQAYCEGRGARFPPCREWRLTMRERQLHDSVRTYRDRSYTVEIGFGSEGQRFDVIIDTGSKALWLVDPSCSNCDTAPEIGRERRRFNHSGSSSFHTNNTEYSLQYAKTSVKGYLATDKLILGIQTVQEQDLLLATNLSSGFRMVAADGIIGLAYPREHPEVPRSALENLAEDLPMFSVFFKRNSTEKAGDGGSIVWGSQDDQNCLEEVNFVPVTHLGDKARNNFSLWTIDLQSYEYNGTKYGEDLIAAIDTGYSIIEGPEDDFKPFITEVNKGVWNESIGYVSDCNTKFQALTLHIAGVAYTIPPDQFV